MDENTNVLMDEEFGVDLSDVFGADAEDGNQTEEAQAGESEQEQTQEETAAEQPAEGQEQAETQQTETKTEPELFEIKFNKDTQKVTREQMTELAQKGLNHDRILQQRDALQQKLNEQTQWRSQNEAALTELEMIAKSSGTDIPGLLNSLQINMLVQNGMSRETAAERIRAERAERKIAENQKQVQNAQRERTQQDQMQQRAARELAAFQEAFPGVDLKTVPKSVFSESASGKNTLVGAYARYQNQQLTEQVKELNAKLAAQEQNQKNKEKSLGSMKSSGSGKNTDDFLRGFEMD